MDKLTILKGLERIAGGLRALGLHPATRLGRRVASLLLGDITIQVNGLSLTGSVLHRGYLWSLREGKREAYMAELFKSVVKPGMVVCDIGSYIGYYALLAAQRVGIEGKVYAFEPDPHSFAYLQRNIRTNHFDQIVIPIPKAVADQSALLTFYISEGDRSGSSLFQYKGKGQEITVECVSLDEFFQEMPASVSVIKMDIEGAEVKALKGMERVLSRSPEVVMFVECNPRALEAAGDDVTQLLEMLRGFGFHIAVIDEQARTLRPVSPEIEKVKYVNLLCQRGGGACPSTL